MTPALTSPAEVGKFYMVPCILVKPKARADWMDRSGWVPVLGPKHIDAEHLDFRYEHFHIDWRFIGVKQYAFANRSRSGTPLATVCTDTEGDPWNPRVVGTPTLRRIRCRREMPEFPVVRKFTAGLDYRGAAGTNWARLERAQAFTCNKLKPGNICPHRGIDLTPFIKADGTVICPGHGLRWDTKTGDLLPHQAVA